MNAKNEPKTLFEASISVKNKIRKITVKSRNDVKESIFDMFCVISQLFLNLPTLSFVHIFISHYALTQLLYFFLKILIFRGKTLEKNCRKF